MEVGSANVRGARRRPATTTGTNTPTPRHRKNHLQKLRQRRYHAVPVEGVSPSGISLQIGVNKPENVKRRTGC